MAPPLCRWLIAAVILLTPTAALADEPGVTRPYVDGFVTNGVRIATAPAHMQAADWWRNALVVGAVGAAYLIDEDIRDSVQRSRTRSFDKLSVHARALGDGLVLLPALGVNYLAGRALGSQRGEETSLLGFESMLLTGVLTQSLQILSHRHRPNENLGKDAFDGVGGPAKADAFPSGHASNAFAVATIVASEYADRPAIPVVAYSLASLVAWSRVNDDKHWTSDVLLGSAIGYGVGKLVFASDPFLRRHNVAMTAAPVPGGAGIGLKAPF